MKLIVTIDTEEDNWANFDAGNFTVDNIEEIPGLQEIFDEFSVRPTYLITYPVATAQRSAGVFKKILKRDGCEIGSHLHPWNTPPMEETPSPRHSMLCNLPEELQLKKVKTLTETLEQVFGKRPVSFRAGRWGYSENVARTLVAADYLVDTSVAPYVDWSSEHGPNFTDVPLQPYWHRIDEVFPGGSTDELIEIPATVGFLQSDFAEAHRRHRAIVNSPLRRLKLYGVAYKLNLLNKIWLSPENHSAYEMTRLTKRLMEKQFPYVNLTFHSPTLRRGLTPFVSTANDERRFLDRIRRYLEFAATTGLKSIGLAEAAAEIRDARRR